MNQAKDKAGRRFRLLDALFLAMTLAPPLLGMALRVLTNPASEDIDISGANVFFTLKMPLLDLPITESQVNGLLVILSVLGLCLYVLVGQPWATYSIRRRFERIDRHLAVAPEAGSEPSSPSSTAAETPVTT